MILSQIPVILVTFYLNSNFLNRFFKNPLIPNFIKTVQWAEKSEIDTWTDRHEKANSFFRHIANGTEMHE